MIWNKTVQTFATALCCLSLLAACDKKKDEATETGSITPIENQPTAESTDWAQGAEDPAADFGKEADFYIQTTQGVLYRKVQGVWTVLMTLKGTPGPAGVAGAAGAKGDKGDAGPQGLTGPIGATGPRGASGANGQNGSNGVAGAKGDKGDKGDAGATGPAGAVGSAGRNGMDGLSSNMLMLALDYPNRDTSYVADRDLKVVVPSNINVLYGTGGNGLAYLYFGRKHMCVYQALGNRPDPAIGSEDFELGRSYRWLRCGTAAGVTEPVLKPSDVVGLASGESLRMTVTTAGTRIPGARIMAGIFLRN